VSWNNQNPTLFRRSDPLGTRKATPCQAEEYSQLTFSAIFESAIYLHHVISNLRRASQNIRHGLEIICMPLIATGAN